LIYITKWNWQYKKGGIRSYQHRPPVHHQCRRDGGWTGNGLGQINTASKRPGSKKVKVIPV